MTDMEEDAIRALREIVNDKTVMPASRISAAALLLEVAKGPTHLDLRALDGDADGRVTHWTTARLCETCGDSIESPIAGKRFCEACTRAESKPPTGDLTPLLEELFREAPGVVCDVPADAKWATIRTETGEAILSVGMWNRLAAIATEQVEREYRKLHGYSSGQHLGTFGAALGAMRAGHKVMRKDDDGYIHASFLDGFLVWWTNGERNLDGPRWRASDLLATDWMVAP